MSAVLPALLHRALTTLAATVALSLGIADSASARTPLDPSPVPEPGPRGSAFPLGFYSVHTKPDMARVRAAGWNMVHKYHLDDRAAVYHERAAKAGLWWLATVSDDDHGPISAEAAGAVVEKWAAEPGLAWWDLPEEMSSKQPEMWETFQTWSTAARTRDPLRRPVYEYIPGFLTIDRVEEYVPWVDIVAGTSYAHYAGIPRAAVRYQVGRATTAIRRAGYVVGDDYAAGEKTPIAVLELFWDQRPEHPAPTADEVYHDAWQAIVSGARGILVYSYRHRNDLPHLRATRDAYFRFSRQLTGDAPLDRAVLDGSEVPGVRAHVVEGPHRTPTFRAADHSPRRSYPSIDVRAWKWQGNRYVVAVNSSPRRVTARLSGLGSRAVFEDLFGAQDDTKRLRFAPLGVHVLRVSPASPRTRTPSDLRLGRGSTVLSIW